MSYEAPLRCQRCGVIIQKKAKAKIPKNCPPCRLDQQNAYKEQLRNNRTRRVRGK